MRLLALGLMATLALGAGEAAADESIRDKWRIKYHQYVKYGFATGTIDEFLEESAQAGLGYIVLSRTPRGVVFASPIWSPGGGFVLFQVKSAQGRNLLLGPQRMGDLPKKGGRVHERYLEFWTLRQPEVVFDEAKHAAGVYFDQLHQAWMFVIRERAAGGRPLQALYYPSRVAVPNLVDAATNDSLKTEGLLKNALPALLHGIKEMLEGLR